jgi:hypothetical protein
MATSDVALDIIVTHSCSLVYYFAAQQRQAERNRWNQGNRCNVDCCFERF